MSPAQPTLFIDPPSHHFLEDRLFRADQAKYAGAQLMAPYAHLRERLSAAGIGVHTADRLPGAEDRQPKVFVSMGGSRDFRAIARRPDVVMSAFFAVEIPIVDPDLYRALPAVRRDFKRLFSWSDSEALRRFTGSPVEVQRFHWPQSFDRVHEELWARSDRRFLVMINSNKRPALAWQELYRERVRAVAYFSDRGRIDLFGQEWDQAPHKLGRSRVPYTLRKLEREARGWWQRVFPDPHLAAARRAYRGRTPAKAETLSNYTFALCFENMVMKGLITEKIFDCFFSGAVPIYWGEPEIERYIPEGAFVDMRKFSGYEELAEFLDSMSPDEIERYRECAREFVGSSRFRPFSKESFAQLFLDLVREDVGGPA